MIGRDDGVIELHPVLPHSAEQAWFWTERWQVMEREAESDIRAGRTETFASPEEFIADLDREAAERPAVKFEQTARFRSDRAALPDDVFAEFRRVVVDQFIPAAVRHAAQPGSARPKGLRVKSVQGAPGVWDMTWS